MFEDTLLIIKADYMHKRKPVLLHLLQHEFMIKGSRKILFSPEYAAEFYKPQADDKDFMLQVILLSKGNSEAFILAKENAVEDLMCTMVCYFSTSVEMEKNVHVSRSIENAAREISFIFPNYIPEPIPMFKPHKFTSNPLVGQIICQLYDIIQKPDESKSWKVQLAEWLTLSNPELPVVSNVCATRKSFFLEDKGQQVNLLDSSDKKPCGLSTVGAGGEPASTEISFASSCSSSTGNSAVLSSSSCMTCRPFERTDAIDESIEDVCKKAERIFAPKTAPLQNRSEEEEEECEDEMCMKVCEEMIKRWEAEERIEHEEMKKVLPYGGKDMETINEAEIEEEEKGENFLLEE